ncbi:MAG: 3'-5' exonuclease [Rhodospirillales bacterium]|jgi:DNA polymerase III subunit epsilon|nr:3'-5' exonuclease [Rhodospirillales bacterium]
MGGFVAIDFETANRHPESACAIGLVRVVDGKIIETEHFLIRPPSRQFVFTGLHGIGWPDVENEPAFAELWPNIDHWLRGADFLAAHNARFDRGVMDACCAAGALPPPAQPWLCTVQLARAMWDIRPTRLPDVCRYLAISLNHHQALSDAKACAEIVIAAQEDGWSFA